MSTANEPRFREGNARADGGDLRAPGDSLRAPGDGSAATDPPLARAETVTFESRGVRCEGDLYLPADGGPPWPTVVLAHVFGAERRWGLGPFAERFAGAGIAAFVFDYRHLGGSDGDPRRLVDPAGQLDDWAAALEYVRSLEVVDGARVALWGTSFSGGHVLAAAAARDEPGIRAVVAQVPYVDGRATVAHQARDRGPVERLRAVGLALADRVGAALGRDPVELPFVSEPGGGGLVDSPGAKAGFSALVPEGEELINRTPARVLFDLPFYRPGLRADDLDVPVHVVVAEEDRLLPPGSTEGLVDRLADPSVHRVPAAHFEVHRDPWFEPVVGRQVAFLSEALSVDPGRGEP